jgi:cytidine deaminase
MTDRRPLPSDAEAPRRRAAPAPARDRREAERQAEALAAARAAIARLKAEGRHHVAATVLTARAAYTAVSLECMLPRGSICAEAVALGMASVAEPGAAAVFSVAVNRRGEVIPPCGFCRELLVDYGPEALIAVGESEGTLRLRPLSDLLPDAYKAHLRPAAGASPGPGA